jgi:hypothetical protein
MKTAERKELEWEVEIKIAHRCYLLETKAEKEGIDYKCTCPNIREWTDGQLKNYLAD